MSSLPQSTVELTSTKHEEPYQGTKKPMEFWLVFLATGIAVFLSALELTSVGTALPTIVEDIGGADFIWIGSAYALASSAFMPASGGLSNIFGRRAVMLSSIAFFAIGSALAGAAKNMNMLIAARAVQGFGGGGIIALSEIIVADLVPLRERGKYGGLLGAVWALASVLGPPVGGALASAGQWRLLFYINIPLSFIAAVLVFFFLKLRTPSGHWLEKVKQIDWIGNGIITGSTAAIIFALTGGGVQYSWSSVSVLVPLLVGFAGLVVFLLYEAYLSKEPTIPIHLLRNRTSLSGYIATFIHGLALTLVVYYLPTYFQGAKNASPTRSGILLFTTATIVAPFAVLTGQSVERTGHYLYQNFVGWALIIVGYATISLLNAGSSTAMGQGLQVVGAVGLGILYSGPMFAILAPLKVEDNAQALALMSYLRTFGQTFGITIGTTILQNGLLSKLPSAFLAQFPSGAEISYAIIPIVHTLPEPLQGQVQAAFASSITNIWYCVAGLGGAGLVASLLMRQIELHTSMDENWGFEASSSGSVGTSRAGTPGGDVEKQVVSA